MTGACEHGLGKLNGTADQIDAALAAVIGSVHNWAPGQAGGRGWERLTLNRITEPLFPDEGLAGYELGFTTAATYHGQP